MAGYDRWFMWLVLWKEFFCKLNLPWLVTFKWNVTKDTSSSFEGIPFWSLIRPVQMTNDHLCQVQPCLCTSPLPHCGSSSQLTTTTPPQCWAINRSLLVDHFGIQFFFFSAFFFFYVRVLHSCLMTSKRAKGWVLWKWTNYILKHSTGQMITRLKRCQWLSSSLTLLWNCFGFCREIVAGAATVEGKNVEGTTYPLSPLFCRNERKNVVTVWKISAKIHGCNAGRPPVSRWRQTPQDHWLTCLKA